VDFILAMVEFILANAIVFYMNWAIKENLAVFNLVDFCSLLNLKNKFYAKFSCYTVYPLKALLVSSNFEMPNNSCFTHRLGFEKLRDINP